MKKLVYIMVIGLGLTAVSCQKQDVQPVSGDMTMPTWDNSSDNAKSGGSGEGEGHTHEASGSNTGHIGGAVITDGDMPGTDITDPNNPGEGSAGRGKE